MTSKPIRKRTYKSSLRLTNMVLDAFDIISYTVYDIRIKFLYPGENGITDHYHPM